MRDLAQLEAWMESPDFEPELARPSVVARLFGLTPQAISVMCARSDRTGVRSYDGRVDVYEVTRWLLRRDETKVTRQLR